jgi:hypothetical protein
MYMRLLYFVMFCSILFNSIKAETYNLNSGDEEQIVNENKTLNPFSFTFGADLVSRYVWRGVEFGVDQNGNSTPHFQPTASLTYSLPGSSTVSLGFWGSYGFNGSYSENDLYFNAFVPTEVIDFSVTLNDYYYPYLGIPFSDFNSDGNGAHTIDAQLAVTLKSYLPVSLLISNNIFNDLPDNKSLYLELGYSFSIENTSIGLFAGAAKGHSVWHSVNTDKFEFVNVGFKVNKSIKITEDYSLPVGIQWIYNHHLKKTFLVFKVTI